jgi:hypothetical protein
MVCRIFRPLCAKHIYATIDARNRTGRNGYSQLKTLLEDSPTIVKYIKYLRFAVRKLDLKNPDVLVVLNQLQNVNKLVIHIFKSLGTCWSAIPELFEWPWSDLFCLRTLPTFELKAYVISPFRGSWSILLLSGS